MVIYTPNMMNTFLECEEKFNLKYIEKLNLPQKNIFFEKGKKIHALANFYLKRNDVSKLENALTDEERNIWNKLKTNKYFKLPIVNTEYNLACKIKDFWIGGRLDALVENYHILDYKTGQIPKNAKENFQTITYLICVDKLLQEKYKNLDFIYLSLKNIEIEEEKITLTPDLKSTYEKKIIDICTKIDCATKSAVFIKSKNCRNCEYNRICNNS